MLRSGWVPLYISEHKHTVKWNVTQIYIIKKSIKNSQHLFRIKLLLFYYINIDIFKTKT